jgi:hypothetical protein
MAAKQYLTPYQQGIVKRFFAHRDSVLVTRLSEAVSELYVCDSDKKREKLWKSALDTMTRAGVDAGDVESLAASRDLKVLAGIVTELQAMPKLPRAAQGAKPSAGEVDGRFE